MGRWTRLILVVMAVSMALSTAVAWMCVLLHETIAFNGARLGQLRAVGWAGHGADRVDDSPEIWLQHSFTGRGVEVIRLRERPGPKSLARGLAPGDVQVTVFRCGWPITALEGRTRLPHGNPDASPDLRYAIATSREVSLEFGHMQNPDGTTRPIQTPMKIKAALPLRPLWPGFAVNTLLLAAVVLVLFIVARSIRAIIRFSRGQCIGCGYPIGVSPRCSECGRLVRSSLDTRAPATSVSDHLLE